MSLILKNAFFIVLLLTFMMLPASAVSLQVQNSTGIGIQNTTEAITTSSSFVNASEINVNISGSFNVTFYMKSASYNYSGQVIANDNSSDVLFSIPSQYSADYVRFSQNIGNRNLSKVTFQIKRTTGSSSNIFGTNLSLDFNYSGVEILTPVNNSAQTSRALNVTFSYNGTGSKRVQASTQSDFSTLIWNTTTTAGYYNATVPTDLVFIRIKGEDTNGNNETNWGITNQYYIGSLGTTKGVNFNTSNYSKDNIAFSKRTGKNLYGIFEDDFTNASINVSNWTYGGDTTYYINYSNGMLQLNPTSGWMFIYSLDAGIFRNSDTLLKIRPTSKIPGNDTSAIVKRFGVYQQVLSFSPTTYTQLISRETNASQLISYVNATLIYTNFTRGVIPQYQTYNDTWYNMEINMYANGSLHRGRFWDYNNNTPNWTNAGTAATHVDGYIGMYANNVTVDVDLIWNRNVSNETGDINTIGNITFPIVDYGANIPNYILTECENCNITENNLLLYINSSDDNISFSGFTFVQNVTNMKASIIPSNLQKRYIQKRYSLSGNMSFSPSLVYDADFLIPDGATNITNSSYAPTYIMWNWTLPVEDIAHQEIWIDGNFVVNVSATTTKYRTLSDSSTSHNISIVTIIKNGARNASTVVTSTTRSPYNSQWWNTSWLYRQPINATYVDSTGLKDQEVLEIALNIRGLINSGKLDSIGSCLRFVDYNNENELPFGNITEFNTSQTMFKIKIVNLSSYDQYNDLVGYFYYMNGSCQNKNDVSTVFDVWDDFIGSAGSAPNSSLWNIYLNGTTPGNAVLDGNGNLVLNGTNGVISSATLKSKYNYTNSTVMELVQKTDSEFYSDVSLSGGTNITTHYFDYSSWWHTIFRTGYNFLWQTPYTYVNNPDIYITDDVIGEIEQTDLNVSYISLNNYSRFKYSYDSSGKLQFSGSDYANRMKYPTHEGSGQSTHPSVYYNRSWLFGYPYWMTHTPYPFSDPSFENPNIAVSYDGYYWFVPSGVVNPIVENGAGGFDADPDIVYFNDSLRIYYGNMSPQGSLAYVQSFDGIIWSDEIKLNANYVGAVSPSINVINSTEIEMYVVNTSTSPNTIEHFNSTILSGIYGKYFINRTTVTFENIPQNITRVEDLEPWHIDTMVNYSGGVDLLITMHSNNGEGNETFDDVLYLATYINTTHFRFQDNPLIIPESGWSQEKIYRSTGFYDQYANNTLRLWFSAIGRKQPDLTLPQRWNIGWTTFDENYVRNRLTQPIEWSNVSSTLYINTNKTWSLSQGEYSDGNGGNRSIDWIGIYRSNNPISYTGIMVDEALSTGIISTNPSTPLTTGLGNQTFNITYNLPVNISWSANGTIQEYDNETAIGSYTNTTVGTGTYYINASGCGAYGCANFSWLWTVDGDAPASVTNATAISNYTHVLMNWSNSLDTDFNYTYWTNNGTWVSNLTNISWNISGIAGQTFNYSAQTVDTLGNVNQTLIWFNSTILYGAQAPGTVLLSRQIPYKLYWRN